MATKSPNRLELFALDDFPMVTERDDIGALILETCAKNDFPLQDDDIVVIAQKIISKAEGRLVELKDIKPSVRANFLAEKTDKDPRLVELILRESNEVVKQRDIILIVEQKLGIVMANAGIDQSNVDQEEPSALLLPIDPDQSARNIRQHIANQTNKDVGVIINDSIGRAWRWGTVGHAIGVSGVPSLWDRRGDKDLYDKALEITEVGTADEIAAAASLMMGQASEGRPVVIMRGLHMPKVDEGLKPLLRPKEKDLFR